MKNPIGFIEEWCDFGEHGDYRAYVLMLIARRKHNEELTNSTEIVHRRILTDREDIEEQYHDLKALGERHPYTFRLYLTVNGRNTFDAFCHFQRRINEWMLRMIRGDEGVWTNIEKVDSEWKSALHSPSAKDDSYFLIDLDDVDLDDVTSFRNQLHEDHDALVAETINTPNGYHLITTPFNYTEWEPSVEYDDLDTDGMMFIEEFEGGGQR